MRRRATQLTRRSRAGFTILEVLLALAILVFGMTAVLGLLTFGAALTKTAEQRTHAAAAAEAVVADLQESLFPLVPAADGTLEPGEPRDVVDKALAGAEGVVYSAKAQPNPQRDGEYRVDVELSWLSGGVRREQRFTTLLLRELPFGERLRRTFIDPDRPNLGGAEAPKAPANTPANDNGAGAPNSATTPAAPAPR